MSATFMTRPPDDAALAPRPIQCTSSRAAPIVDVALALGEAATAAAFLTSRDSPGQFLVGVPLAALAAVQATSAYVGFASARRCEKLQALPSPVENALERELQRSKLGSRDGTGLGPDPAPR